MLIFFLIAGSIAPSPDAGLTLVRVRDLEAQPPREALVLTEAGGLRLAGEDWPGELADGAAAYLETLTEEPRVARLMPDRAAPAETLVELAEHLRAAGAERVLIMGERDLP